LIDGQRLTISQNFKRKQTLVLTLSLMSHSIGKKGVVRALGKRGWWASTQTIVM